MKKEIIEKDRISPKIWHPYYFILSFIRNNLADFIKNNDLSYKDIIDIGSGVSPYKSFFKNSTFLTLDPFNKFADIKKYASNTGINDNSINFILCTEVCEHISEIEPVFKEFYRILKKDGNVFITTPFLFPQHDIENDFFRITNNGLCYLAKKNNFRIEKNIKNYGFFKFLSININYFIFKESIFLRRIFFCVIFVINILALFLDKILSLIFFNNKKMKNHFESFYTDAIIILTK